MAIAIVRALLRMSLGMLTRPLISLPEKREARLPRLRFTKFRLNHPHYGNRTLPVFVAPSTVLPLAQLYTSPSFTEIPSRLPS